MERAKTRLSARPRPAALAGAAIYCLVAMALSLICVPIADQPAWVWALRIVMVFGGIALVVLLVRRVLRLEALGKLPDPEHSPIDHWTLAHAAAGMIIGAWGIPALLGLLFTIGWEIFEYVVPGFGDKEIPSNRLIDLLVAWGGWILIAGLIGLITRAPIPWLLPSIHSLMRGAGLQLF
jgi:hypothetical protein